ncbi:MAG: OmpA family protein [Treponema sp.]|jgi:outer membrane protein OmpA-like peptidoglycan-associated protein|nr:OmpA family protein [Treponema sp.]
MNKPVVFFFLFAVSSCLPAGAERFFYKYETGNKYRIVSIVNEDVYVNRRFSHRARILNRSAVEIGEIQGDSAEYRANFQTAEQILEGGGSFQWSMEYDSVFYQDKFGYMTIDDKYYMPVVRNVPAFPDRDLKEGESWAVDGHEMHDFRNSFGIAEPYRIPFTANYVFLGMRDWKGQSRPAFSVSYRIFYEPKAVPGTIWPRRIMGASDQIIYWDTEIGQAIAYDETFRMMFELSSGSTVEYRGRAEAEIIESEIMKKEEVAQEIAREIEKLGIDDASVRIADEGIIISLENIQFAPDSAVLLSGEKTKLDKIGEILLMYPERDILVGGHTALAGTAAARQRLSLERAAAVSDYLISKNIRGQSRVVVRGYGSEKPLADNSTAEGMRKNRRVEITLLEN